MMSSIRRLGKGRRFSRVVVHGGTAYFSGLTAPGDDIAAQTRNLLAKADDLLAELGIGRSALLLATIWLKDIGDYDGMNEVWEEWVDQENPPARATVESSLAAPDLLIEIQFTAAVG